jgi:hypothetical protein
MNQHSSLFCHPVSDQEKKVFIDQFISVRPQLFNNRYFYTYTTIIVLSKDLLTCAIKSVNFYSPVRFLIYILAGSKSEAIRKWATSKLNTFVVLIKLFLSIDFSFPGAL